MQSVWLRVLLHGGLTAGVLAAVGVGFAELAGIWIGGPARPGSTDLNPPVNDTLRFRVPLLMAFWGFVFVAGCELIRHRLRARVPVKPPEPPADDAEKLLNELLAQAEAKMAAEGSGEGQGEKGEEAKKQEPPSEPRV